MSTHDNSEPMEDWHPEPHPWCRDCCVPATACACPNVDTESHIIRGEE